VETRRKMAITVAEDVARVLKGQRPLYPLNPEVLSSIDRSSKGKL